MKETIDRVIEINDNAENILKEAQKKSDVIIADAEEKAKAVKSETDKTAEAEINDIYLTESKKRDSAIEKINNKRDKDLLEFETRFNETRKQWITEIVSGIIGR